MAFCGGAVNHDEFFVGIQSVVGKEVPIIGGSALGIITNTFLSYEGHPAGVAILQSGSLKCAIATAGDLDKDEELAGKRIAEQLSSEKLDESLLLLFYDSIKIPPPAEGGPPVMNSSTPLLAGIKEVLEKNIPIIGSGVIGDFSFSPTQQFCSSYVANQSAVGALLSGDFTAYTKVAHGCTPMDGIYRTVTKTEGEFLYDLDNKPVVEVIDEIYGNQEWQQQMPVKRLTIGVNMGGRYEEFQEQNYVNRLISGALPDGKGIVMFESDLEVGTEIQFLLRDANKMFESAKKIASEALAQIAADGKEPVFGFYVNCAGRSASFSETLKEEASEVVDIFNEHNIPLFGFYTGVELAPFHGVNRGLDWTGVLTIFAT